MVKCRVIPGKEGVMKKAITPGLVILLVAAMVTTTIGCGGDTTQAKEYMDKGDAILAEANSQASEISSSMSGPANDVNDPAKFEADVKESKVVFDKFAKMAEEAIIEFKKIKSLKGVDDYIKYADLRIEYAELMQKTMEEMSTLMDEALALVKAGNPAGVMDLYSQVINESDKRQEQVSALSDEASKLKSEKNL